MSALIEEVRQALWLPDPATRMAIRRRAHVSRERLAAEVGVQPLAVARWERGTRNPRGDVRIKYARLLRLLDEVATMSAEGRRSAETS